MFRTTLLLTLGLLAAVTLGCEKKQEAPTAPDTSAVEGAAADAHDAAADAMDEAKDTAEEAVDEGADAAKDAIDNATAPQ